MRSIGILSLAFVATVPPLGCGTNPSPEPVPNAATSTADDKVRAAEAARAKRDQFVLVMQRTLDELDAKSKTLEGRAADAKGDMKMELDEKLKVAKARRDAAAARLRELKEAGHDRWDKVKDGVENAFDDLKKVFE